MKSGEWSSKVAKLENEASIRFALAMAAFSDVPIEWEARRFMMAQALSVSENAIDRAMEDVKKVGLAVENWIQ